MTDRLPISPWIEYSPVLLPGVLGPGLYALEKCTIRAGNRTIHGKHGSKTLHGNARWASTAEVKRAGLLDQSDGGVVVGGFGGRQLIDRSNLHTLVFAPTGQWQGGAAL